MKNINNIKKWYSVIISLVIIWLLLVLSTWVLNMILTEMKDNRWMWENIKAYAWAESSQELALLKIKEKWYGYYAKITHDINNQSIVLWEDSIDINKFNKKKDVFISYDIWSKVTSYDWIIKPLSYDIIPLFFIDDLWEHKINNYDFSILTGDVNDISWNIIWKNNWITWTWINTDWIMKKISLSNELQYSEVSINDFLLWSDLNYLILFNTWNSNLIEYNINSINWDYFSKPKTNIISSWEIGEYKQNLSTLLDNSQFLNRQKYSIYSN